jgi:DNA gyrase subunit A
MAKKKPIIDTTVVDMIEQEELSSVLNSSYIRYAYKVIEDRAIPDARDGLKPSQRRILFAMGDLALNPNKQMKCAKIVGETMGNYHPHGDASLYGTLVGMAQPWSIRCPLVAPQGNFGSVDGHPPAAQRYTEAGLSHAGLAMLEDVSPRIVSYKRTYDDQREEPTVLPSLLPNLLLNGCSGIAVGYATNFPPHNHRELAAVFEAYIRNPKISTREIMKLMPGPDFPTGGRLMGQDGVFEYYETGRGSMKIEGVYSIETTKKGGEIIVITEFPEGGSPEKFRTEIKDLVERNKIGGISECSNYSSNKTGTRVVVEIGRNGNAQVVLNQILSHTCLRISYSVNSTVLIDGRLFDKAPLIRLIQAFIDHRKEVLTRRFQAELADALHRIEILEGLISVSSQIDETIKIIRASDNPEMAAAALIAKGIVRTDAQAKAVLAITLAKLTKLEQNSLLDEKKRKDERVAWLNKTLASNQDILQLIIEEQNELAKKLGDERRTKIDVASTGIKTADLINVEDVVVSITTDDCIKRVALSEYEKQARGGVGVKASDLKDSHFIQSMFTASTHDDLLCFTDTGRVFKLRVFELPEATRTARGRPIINFVNLKDGEKICTYLPIKQMDKQTCFLSFLSKNGLVKRIALKEFAHINKGGIIATKIKEDDRIVSVLTTNGVDDLLLVTHLGSAIRFSEFDVRISGRMSSGVIGIRLDDDDHVIGGVAVPMMFDKDGNTITADQDLTMMTITSNGWGKRTAVDEYLVAPTDGGKLRQQSRGGKGRIDMNIESKVGKSVGVIPLKNGNDIVVITKEGKMVRVSAKTIRVLNRGTNGTRLVKLNDGDEVITAAPVAQDVDTQADNADELVGSAAK